MVLPIDQSVIITISLFIDPSRKYRLENQSFDGRYWCDHWFTRLDHLYETFLEILVPQDKYNQKVGRFRSSFLFLLAKWSKWGGFFPFTLKNNLGILKLVEKEVKP